MRTFIIPVLALLVLLAASCTPKTPAVPQPYNNLPEGPYKAVLGQRLAPYPNGTMLVLTVIDRINGTQYVGVERRNDTLVAIPAPQDLIFEIGSITKVFTGIILAQDIQAANLEMNTPVAQLYDFQFNPAGQAITLGQLATHTSGLPRIPPNMGVWVLLRQGNPYSGYTRARLHEYLQKTIKPETVPGSKYAYSNLGFGLLGDALCNQWSLPYETLLRNRILAPFEMNNTSTDRKSLPADKLVQGRKPNGKPTPYWDIPGLPGAGAILSSSADMTRFVQANFTDDDFLIVARRPQYAVSDSLRIGLGWNVSSQTDGSNLYWHNGGTGGFRSFMGLDMAARKAVIILSNISPSHAQQKEIDALGMELVR